MQSAFVTVCCNLDEVPEGKEREDLALVIKALFEQRILGVKNKNGAYVPTSFPKIIYMLDEMNVPKDSKYHYLNILAAKCTAYRMVPDYISAKVQRRLKVDKNGEGHTYPSMGCRSFLTPYVDPDTGKPRYYSRFNQGVVTINLPYVALESKKDINKFWELLETRLEMCHKALQIRHQRLVGVRSDVAPILWQNGALARLQPGEKIDKLLYGGYSTISLGYVGIYETVMYLTGKKHWIPDEEGGALNLAKAIMKKLNDKCKEWKEAENMDYSVYGTPEESTTYKFAKSLQKNFGIIEGVTDKNYVTNSYHVPVFEEIDAFEKLSREAPLQELSPGGAISYVEVPPLHNNLDAIIALQEHIYENIMYAELNSKLDYCLECDFMGEVSMVEEEGKLIWKCPNCGNTNLNTMQVIRRVCGYLSNANDMNQGRKAEIKDRVLHL